MSFYTILYVYYRCLNVISYVKISLKKKIRTLK